jgi:hypothetical protein
MSKNILRMTLKKKWFDMIASGEKKEEYRDIKDHWTSRLLHFKFDGTPYVYPHMIKWYDEIEFINGYRQDSPRIRVEFKGLEIGEGKPEWGGEKGKKVFIIKLGELIK